MGECALSRDTCLLTTLFTGLTYESKELKMKLIYTEAQACALKKAIKRSIANYNNVDVCLLLPLNASRCLLLPLSASQSLSTPLRASHSPLVPLTPLAVKSSIGQVNCSFWVLCR